MNERQKTAQVLADARDTLRRVTYERDCALQKCAELIELTNSVQTRLEAEKLAAEAHENGSYSHLSFPDLVDYFEKAAQEGRLPVIKEAMVARAPDMGRQYEISSNDESQSNAEAALVGFLVGNVG